MKFAEYGSLLTQAYDIDKPDAPAQELEWHRRFIKDGDQPVLAAMCGSGRFLVPLARDGIDIDGVDASPDMLAACRAKLQRGGLTVDTYEQKLQALDLPRRYASIYVGGGGSFGLIPDRDDALEALRRMHAHLEPGGRLRLELQTPGVAKFQPLGRVNVRSWVRPDGARIVLSTSAVRFEDNVLEAIGKYELFKDGKLIDTELDDFPVRLYEGDEFGALLEDGGFTDVVVTKAYTDEPPSHDDLLLSFRTHR